MDSAKTNPATREISRQYFPALDGLRGLAILLVVVYHNFGFIEKYFFFGWLGVDLFFVLSGFLITNILLKEQNSQNFLSNFYIRRILRIFPLYYLCLILFLIVLPRFNLNLDLKYYTDNQVWIWTYLQNWLYIFKNPPQTNTLNHLWSLAVEEQFYLLWPLVILLLRKPKYLLIFVTFLLIAVLGLRLWIWLNHISNLAYYNLYTFTRIDGICVGAMVALMQKIKPGLLKKYTPAIVLFFAALNFLFFFVNRFHQFTFPYLALVGYTTFAMLLGLLLNETITKENKLLNNIFLLGFLRFIGKISYGFYIFHWPVYLVLKPLLMKWSMPSIGEGTAGFIVSLTSSVIALVLSWISYKYFESYFLKMKARFT